ncbi:hypothetical protein Bbelb_228200 [Branchiostoma belcheri]|nr:hypothetical protein Bbelb_228200 [Branchiostoma belcheri]
MGFFWPTPKFLFLSFLILSTGAVYLYMYVSNNGVKLSPEEIVIGALTTEKGPSTTSPSWPTSTLPANILQNSLSDSDNIPHFNPTSTSSPCTSQSLVQDNWDSLAEAEKEQARRLATFKAYCEKNPSTHYSEEEARLRLATYRKIIVVRDPLERSGPRVSSSPSPSPPAISLNGFNFFIFGLSDLKFGMEINYDFIAHTDTIASDVRLFLKKNNITANEDILPEQRQRHVNDDNVFGDIYGQVPIEDILPLRDIFQEDFDMFGYSFEQDLAEILKGKTKAKG